MNNTLASLVITALALGCAADTSAQVRAEYDRGAGALSRQLQRLQTTASVLHTGAHPDDEDSALIAYHARHDNARTAYLSLTRGSGGQNIIGPEQSDLLGVIRSEELLQARRLDGAEQFFTRAVDFGFSKTRDEGRRLWDEETLLGDMVQSIRRFRPAVVVSRWNGTQSDGHGHHQFAGYLTPLALEAAADPARFPEQIEQGLEPWQVSKLYVGERGSAGPLPAGMLAIDTGRRDPIAGRSYFQIGMRGRSQQKTQQMGSLELHGSQRSMLRQIKSNVDASETDNDVFDGLDTSISAIARFESRPAPELLLTLNELERLAADALNDYQALEPLASVSALAQGLAVARNARRLAQSFDARRLLDEKVEEFEWALVLASGITVDALAERETVTPGDRLQVAIRAFNLDASGSTVVAAALETPADWSHQAIDAAALANEQRFRRREQADAAFFYEVQVANDTAPTEPYWLRSPRQQAMYDWSQAGDAQTLAFQPALLQATVALEISGQPVRVHREVRHRQVDRVRGELRRRIDVVPAVSVEPATRLEIIPAGNDQRRYRVALTVHNHSKQTVDGTATVQLPAGWQLQPETMSYSLAAAPASNTLKFSLAPPDDVAPGTYTLPVIVNANGRDYRQTMTELRYPHVDTHRVYDDAVVTYSIIDVDVAPVKVGYIMGSGDSVPEALRRLGLEVTLLDESALTAGSLSRLDVIVVGIRASQTRPDYVAANARLLDFVRAGGTMIVQYQQPDFAEKGLAPFPVKMERNVRVVDETAPVTILAPEHPVFSFPNRIGPTDFEGWVQERNNYNFTDFDRDRYLPLTESHDPGEPDSDGAMLYARLGKGHYVYTAYSWFRQLPNGTPGGYRIFANLLSLPAHEE